jgi:hypothetical protein
MRFATLTVQGTPRVVLVNGSGDGYWDVETLVPGFKGDMVDFIRHVPKPTGAGTARGSRGKGQSEQHRAGQDHDTRPDPVAQRTPAEAGGAHREEVERHGAGHGRIRPAGSRGDLPQEHGEREHGADRDARHEGAERHHHPPIPTLAHEAISLIRREFGAALPAPPAG